MKDTPTNCLFASVCSSVSCRLHSAHGSTASRKPQQQSHQQIRLNPMSKMAEDLPDYSQIDQEDGFDAEMDPVGPTEDVDFFEVPDDSQGLGWFDRRNAALSSGIDLTALDFYQTFPRPYDRDVAQIPSDHPIRAIAKILESTAENSTVRIKCYRLTDCFAIDLLLHYGSDRDIRLILDYVPEEDIADDIKKNSVRSLMRFLEYNKHFGSYAIFRQIEIRVAVTSQPENRHCCQYGYSSMHEKQIITDSYSVYGSYTLTGYARCKNYESIRISASRQEESESFDRLWNELGSEREISIVYPQIIPTLQRKKLRID
jgi:hypothetical protein